jgi:hypothetical protein
MAIERCLITLKTVDNLPANFLTNSLWFDVVDDTDYPVIAAVIEEAYDLVIAEFSNLLAQNNHDIQFYRESDPTPRVPRYESTFNLVSAPSGSPLPREVALCCSFQAGRISGESQARRRGRVYIGMLDSATVGADGRPDAAVIDAVAAFGNAILGPSLASTSWKWAVYSRMNGSGSEVLDGWVDNAFDTQRRRGDAPTARTTFS